MTDALTGVGFLRSLGLDRAFAAAARPLPARWRGCKLSPPGWLWVIASFTAVALTLRRADAAAAACLASAGVLLGVDRALRGAAAPLVPWAGEVALGLAAVFASAWSDESITSLWLGGAVAFSAAAQEYGGIVFAKTVRDTGRAEPLDLGARRSDGAVIGWTRVPRLASLVRVHRSDLGGWLVVYLAAGRPAALLATAAALSTLSLVATTAMRARIIRALEARMPPPAPPGLRGRARWARLVDAMLGARDDAFWGVCVARPIAAIVLYPAAEAPWLTPNRVTALSTAIGVAAGLAAIAGGSLLGASVALIAIRSVLDSLDGQLARYRRLSSHFGSYLDKALDGFVWASLYAATAVRAHARLATPAAVLVPLAALALLAFQGLTFWHDRLAHEDGVASTPSPPRGGIGR
ncbi:MAG: CDP-alcohol phosphatidyltransferase family protein, partial [Myxococcota bacterium]